MSAIRYVHTSIVAKDWRRLVEFYERVFGAEIVPPERDLRGEWLDDLTGIPQVHVEGAHLALPGHGDRGPTLEIFSYTPPNERADSPGIDRQGFGHIAFEVDDVESMVERIRSHGGGLLGSIVRHRYEEIGTLIVAYCYDPEGNYIEVQNWST